ncbi:unnamed protein product [Rotaria sp. Silwood1]|nr:unnamed protein product [Rotaria sp. Silwood1]CAF1420599.1 unnamed protein product [Rotaria sp. Silwood1]CAF1435283.1 unnamed protein product [Rotaria sp. Silwood1]CAF3522912.1 unnamed protein product [Rotaria sp. Silwood1]CAF3589045.1 unnamed protein product [Rotaria sp. Silwood1]
MARQTSLDDIKDLRLINDKPIRILFFAEATANLGLILFVFLYPSTFLALLLKPDNEITSLATHILSWWNSWILVISGLMFAAIPSKYNTPTLTAGLIHVRRFLYWGLLSSEIFLASLLISTKHRTFLSIGFAIVILLVVIGRLIILFPKKAWFGTVVIESTTEKHK